MARPKRTESTPVPTVMVRTQDVPQDTTPVMESVEEAVVEEPVVASEEYLPSLSEYWLRIPLQEEYAILVSKPNDFFHVQLFLEKTRESGEIQQLYVCETVVPPHATENTMMQIAKKAIMNRLQVLLQFVNRASSLVIL